MLAFFGGCEEDEDEWPTPPTAAGTYYGIGNFGSGEESVKLVIQESPGAASGGHHSGSVEAVFQTLGGSISYGGETYSISGTAEDDSLNITWTTAEGTWTLAGTFDAEGIRGTTSGPGGTHDFIAYRQTEEGRDISGMWLGYFQTEDTRPPLFEGPLAGSFLQSDSVIMGYLVVSGDSFMGDTLTISEGFFFDPIIELTAIDSGVVPPSTLHLVGTLVTADSAAGAYHWWWWGANYDWGSWHLTRAVEELPDTSVFSGILAVVYVREGTPLTISAASVYWQIDGEGVSGATITVDGVPLQDLGNGSYLTAPGAITVVPGEEYTFDISHPEYGNTSGTAQVPGNFTVTSPLPDAVVPVGEDLVVTFTEAAGATFYTAMLYTNAAVEVVQAPTTSITLPGSDIQTPGDDVLEVEAMRGDYSHWEATHTGYFGLVGKTVNVTVQ